MSGPVRADFSRIVAQVHPHVFATGDVVGLQILHISAAESQVAGHNAAMGSPDCQDLAVIFTSLTAARTGLTEARARKAGLEVVTACDNPAQSGRGVTDKERFGLWKLIAEKSTGRLREAQILKANADASIHLAKMAINARYTVAEIFDIVLYHPTRVERLKGLADTICQHLGRRSVRNNNMGLSMRERPSHSEPEEGCEAVHIVVALRRST